MNVYEHRRDDAYLAVLKERLTIEGPNGLLAKAVPISKPFLDGEKTFERCCRIDFNGIAATNLFDAGGNVVPSSVADRIETLLMSLEELNNEGVFVKLRFLLVYPYCTYAFSRMQAELSRNRSSMKQPLYGRDFSLVESVDNEMFLQSSFVRSQTLMLEQLQEWLEKYGWSPIIGGRSVHSVNGIHLRFAPVSPNQCVLFVNDTIFVDAYLLAKEQREKKRCANLAPLVAINRNENPETFSAFDDHVRDLWDLDMTIYADDATYYQPGRPGSLRNLKTPDKVTFEHKASHIRDKVDGTTDDSIQKWRFKVSRLLNRQCTFPAATPSSESLFITCSWQKGKDGVALPNAYAQDLSNMLETDFGRIRQDPILSVHIMEGVAGEFLTTQLYARLDEATLALVLMTADVKGEDGRGYCKPNVYHELGFLMKHIGTDRVLLVCEQGISIPSNIQDVIRIDFARGKLSLCYREILRWLNRACSCGRTSMIEALERHKLRLEESGGTTRSERKEATRKVQTDIEIFRPV
jgi:hypothetical protein